MRNLRLWRKPAHWPHLEDMRGMVESLGRKVEGVRSSLVPRVHVQETDKSVVVSARLPGFDKRDIDVDLSSTSLTIRGQKKGDASSRKHGIAGLIHARSAFRHTVALPAAVRPEECKAVFHEETLRVEMPKQREAQTRKIEIQ